MRAGIGLVALLVTVGVIVMVMHTFYLPSLQNAANVQKNVRPKVQQIAGQTTDGVDARTTITLKGQESGGKMNGVIVSELTPGGAMEQYFGLKKGDTIIEIAPQGGAFMPVKDMSSAAEAKDLLLSAYQNSQKVVVLRNGEKLTLPAATTATAAPTPAPAAPAAPAAGSSLQQQLDSIQKVPTH